MQPAATIDIRASPQVFALTPPGTPSAYSLASRTKKEREMPGNPSEMITTAERTFPVRIRIGIPPGGLGRRHTQMTAWLDENCGADGWAMTPSGMRGVLN